MLMIVVPNAEVKALEEEISILEAEEQGRRNEERLTLLKAELERRGAWSQYMEVGIGPDAEVFSKSQPMSAVGFGADVGLLAASIWNNPEPEIVLAVNSRGEVVGAELVRNSDVAKISFTGSVAVGKSIMRDGPRQ